MLYDVFISHASEDKDAIARPLAEALRELRVEVWFDEFSLTVGSGLRQSIDRGLAKSRFGIIILSLNFFGKAWPEWELNGLVQRHLDSRNSLLLPIWHGVGRSDVLRYSPSLADILAIKSDLGAEQIARQLIRVIQPEESALVVARNMLLDRSFEPPVISDDWWLDAIESSGDQHASRWFFHLHTLSSNRGQQLGWTVMQYLWQQAADEEQITQLSKPSDVVKFIRQQPGLLEACKAMPRRLLEFAPQLGLYKAAAELEPFIESAYQKSLAEYQERRKLASKFGSGLTTNGLCPACDEEFTWRHPNFGDYEPAMVACGFVMGNGAGLGPLTRAYPFFEYLIYLLSAKSNWIPPAVHACLLEGMKTWAQWIWHGRESDSDYEGKYAGQLWKFLRGSENMMTPEAAHDLEERIDHSRSLLGLPESTQVLTRSFLEMRFIEAWRSERLKDRQVRERDDGTDT